MRLSRLLHAPIPLVLAAFVAVAAEACSSGTKSPAPAATPVAAEGTPEFGLRIIPLGRTAATEAAEVTIHAVRLSREEGGERVPGGRWWMLFDVAVRNTAPEAQPFHARLMDAYWETEFERAFPPGATEAFDAPIPAGEEVRGEIAFIVTRGGAGSTLLYGVGDQVWALQVGLVQPPD